MNGQGVGVDQPVDVVPASVAVRAVRAPHE